MTDPRMSKLAELLVNYSVKVQPGDVVQVRGEAVTEPLIVECIRYVTLAGGYPVVELTSEAAREVFLRNANEDQLKYVSPFEKHYRLEADCTIYLDGSNNTRSFNTLDPKKQQIAQSATRAIRETFMQRAADGDVRWTLTMFPCQAYAQEADMSLSEYEDFVYNACYCDKDDPVAEWLRVQAEQQKVVDWLAGKKQITIKSPNADLSLSIEGRKFVNADGRYNMPDGEVFTGPVEDSVNGWVQFTYPAIRGGREVEGVRLEFKDGKVIKASAEKNEEYLLSQLDSDEGSRILGEFAIGTNFGIKQFTKEILFDEKIGGSFHMAVGAGYPETGSKNKSAVHWDFICDVREDSEIRVDGELLYKDGVFQI